MKDLEIIVKKQESIIEGLIRRVQRCEEVAQQYEYMYKQIQSEMKALADRQGNIQQVYDYMTRVGSAIAIKSPHDVKRLNPVCKVLPKDDKKYLEVVRKAKFQVGEQVFYADESVNCVREHIISGIDVIDKHPRYCFESIIG